MTPAQREELRNKYKIPYEVIDKGDEAIQKYAKDNKITLPQRPQPPRR
jgi:hypothetical protein